MYIRVRFNYKYNKNNIVVIDSKNVVKYGIKKEESIFIRILDNFKLIVETNKQNVISDTNNIINLYHDNSGVHFFLEKYMHGMLFIQEYFDYAYFMEDPLLKKYCGFFFGYNFDITKRLSIINVLLDCKLFNIYENIETSMISLINSVILDKTKIYKLKDTLINTFIDHKQTIINRVSIFYINDILRSLTTNMPSKISSEIANFNINNARNEKEYYIIFIELLLNFLICKRSIDNKYPNLKISMLLQYAYIYKLFESNNLLLSKINIMDNYNNLQVLDNKEATFNLINIFKDYDSISVNSKYLYYTNDAQHLCFENTALNFLNLLLYNKDKNGIDMRNIDIIDVMQNFYENIRSPATMMREWVDILKKNIMEEIFTFAQKYNIERNKLVNNYNEITGSYTDIRSSYYTFALLLGIVFKNGGMDTLEPTLEKCNSYIIDILSKFKQYKFKTELHYNDENNNLDLHLRFGRYNIYIYDNTQSMEYNDESMQSDDFGESDIYDNIINDDTDNNDDIIMHIRLSVGHSFSSINSISNRDIIDRVLYGTNFYLSRLNLHDIGSHDGSHIRKLTVSELTLLGTILKGEDLNFSYDFYFNINVFKYCYDLLKNNKIERLLNFIDGYFILALVNMYYIPDNSFHESVLNLIGNPKYKKIMKNIEPSYIIEQYIEKFPHIHLKFEAVKTLLNCELNKKYYIKLYSAIKARKELGKTYNNDIRNIENFKKIIYYKKILNESKICT